MLTSRTSGAEMTNLRRFDVYGKELMEGEPDMEWFWVRKCDHDFEMQRMNDELQAYRSLAGIGLRGTDEADELAKITPSWERDKEAYRRVQKRDLEMMSAVATTVREQYAHEPNGDEPQRTIPTRYVPTGRLPARTLPDGDYPDPSPIDVEPA